MKERTMYNPDLMTGSELPACPSGDPSNSCALSRGISPSRRETSKNVHVVIYGFDFQEEPHDLFF